MQKFFDILPPEYKKREMIIYKSTQKPKKRGMAWAVFGIVFLSSMMNAWPTMMSRTDTYFYPNISRPEPSFLPDIKDIVKKIEINLRTQRLALWENEKKISEYVVSTGKRTTPTKAGNFSVISKYPMAYGGVRGMSWAMPYFIGIYTAAGQENGIHELPFLNGQRESASSLGYPVSHGCVRLPIGKAELVYNWAEIGTPIIIHY